MYVGIDPSDSINTRKACYGVAITIIAINVLNINPGELTIFGLKASISKTEAIFLLKAFLGVMIFALIFNNFHKCMKVVTYSRDRSLKKQRKIVEHERRMLDESFNSGNEEKDLFKREIESYEFKYNLINERVEEFSSLYVVISRNITFIVTMSVAVFSSKFLVGFVGWAHKIGWI